MELLLLGSGAAEGWPAPFCLCEACQEARRLGGVDIRSRSSALIDEDLKIDLSPDTVMQMQRSGRNLAAVRTVLFTHHHFDHLAPREMLWATAPFTNNPPVEPIALYGNEAVLDELVAAFPAPAEHHMVFYPVEPLRPFQTVTGDAVLPMLADHDRNALVYRIQRGGKTLFYGHDSGLYPAATLEALTKGPKLDIALMDCTNGPVKTDERGHMGVDGVVRMTQRLREAGVVTEQTRVIATHFSHNGRMMHEDLVRVFMEHRIEVAFDGMVVRV